MLWDSSIKNLLLKSYSHPQFANSLSALLGSYNSNFTSLESVFRKELRIIKNCIYTSKSREFDLNFIPTVSRITILTCWGWKDLCCNTSLK